MKSKTQFPVTRKEIKARLVSFNPMDTKFSSHDFSMIGKGYGWLEDSDGKQYFLYGQEIGGGMHGEDADPSFLKIGEEYTITSFWVDPDKNSFFMGKTFRVKSIQRIDGTRPNLNKLKEIKKRVSKIIELQKNFLTVS